MWWPPTSSICYNKSSQSLFSYDSSVKEREQKFAWSDYIYHSWSLNKHRLWTTTTARLYCPNEPRQSDSLMLGGGKKTLNCGWRQIRPGLKLAWSTNRARRKCGPWSWWETFGSKTLPDLLMTEVLQKNWMDLKVNNVRRLTIGNEVTEACTQPAV